ncbi:MAG: hypothetical protein AAFQ19_03625 [Pseudomonadota bacterium]
MLTRTFFPALLIAVLTAACAPVSPSVTRGDAMMLQPPQRDLNAAVIADQAQALRKMANDLVYRSTLRGAATGALVGCGLVVVAASHAKNCVAGAAVGGLAGAAVGHAQGQREVAKRVELVSANALVRSIRGMNAQMDALQLSLPALLAEQDAEIADLQMRRDSGALSEAAYAASMENIRQSRALIAAHLSDTVTQAELAQGNLQEASQRGQTGLDWHLGATGELMREAQSARSSISLL